MATVEESRAALEALAARLSDLDENARATHLADRSMSVTVTDLGITFVTQLGMDGASPVTQAPANADRANIRFRTSSDDLIAIAADPGRFARAWLTGRVRVDASLGDLFRLRKLL
ncbi:MAG: SCP-2 sterol transfer family protein [Streptosporangiaceae bacterium]